MFQTRLLSLWTDRKVRGLLVQAVALALVVAFFAFVGRNTALNMEKLGIASGFNFLTQPAGFNVAMSVIPYEMTGSHGRVFLVGAANTLLVSILGIVAATLLGVIIGVSRLSHNWIVAKLATVYVESFRNLPLLFQILFWYGLVLSWPKVRESLSFGDVIFINNRGIEVPLPVFEAGSGIALAALLIGIVASLAFRYWAKKRQQQRGERWPTFWISLGLVIGLPMLVAAGLGFPWVWDIPALKGFNFKGGMTIMTSLVALWFALTIYTSTFIAENVRAGIQAVSEGQWEAAASLGLQPSWTMRFIVLPQALRVIIPPLISQYLNLIKNSSLAVAIGYPDIVNVFSGTTLNQTGQAVEVILMTMAFYLSISLLISMSMNYYNKRVALRGGGGR